MQQFERYIPYEPAAHLNISQPNFGNPWSERKFSIYFRMISDLCVLSRNELLILQ